MDAAADGLVAEHPFLTRAKARRIVVAIAYVGWLATLVGLSVAAGPIFGILAALAGGVGWDANKVGSAAGKAVDALPDRLFGENDGSAPRHPGPEKGSNDDGPD